MFQVSKYQLFSFEKRLGKGIPIGLKTCRTFPLPMLAPLGTLELRRVVFPINIYLVMNL
jgi:hypothetical protein